METITSMSQIFNRVYRLLKSRTSKEPSFPGYEPDFDNDLKEAWEELEDFLSGNLSGGRKESGIKVPGYLEEDYRTMGLETGAPFSLVRERYIILVRKLHPDRFARNPGLQAEAEEKLKKINMAFGKIKTWEDSRSDN